MFNIKAKTILVQKPEVMDGNATGRIPRSENIFSEKLIHLEGILRRKAYMGTAIKTDESFFDDSDMQSDYYLIVVFYKKTMTPLLSARYYFTKSVIKQYLQVEREQELNIDDYPNKKLFLIDRMSANVHSSIYHRYRDIAHFLFFVELLVYNRGCSFLAMARKEKRDKLLSKYLNLGLKVVGELNHQEKHHWILLGTWKQCYSKIGKSVLLNFFFILEYLRFKWANQ